MDKKYQAKKEAVKKLRKLMSNMSGEDISGKMSAKVVADDPESLKEGLKKASEVVDDDYSVMSKDDLIKLLKNRG